MVRCSCLQSYTTKISIKILFTILLTISVIYTFQLQICSMTEQDLFYLLALQRVEGVGDIWLKNYSLIAVAQRQF
jgi:hypothetical protein